MKKFLAIWKIARKLYTQAKANPTRAKKFEDAVTKVATAKNNTEFVKAVTNLGFAVKDLYSAPKKPVVKRKPKVVKV